MDNFSFDRPYNREEYLRFFQNDLLPEDFSLLEEVVNLDFTPEHIREVTFLGISESMGLKVYEIEYGPGKDCQIAKDPRVKVTKEIFRLMKQYNDRHALAIIHSKTSSDFRFSFLTIGIDTEDTRIIYDYSNPRRYSFILGPTAKINTPKRFLISKGRIRDFADLKSRFSIEVVNKDFYSQIALLFTKLVGGERKVGSRNEPFEPRLKLPSVSDHLTLQEFAVRMIGRIVFCWFLKKKTNARGESLIPEEILSLQAVKDNKRYYHNMLEKLFFQVLNTPVKKRRNEFKSGHFSRIPFLNGGLFEPHCEDFYDLNDLSGTSKNDNTVKIPDDWLETFFEVLETYHFTIDENTSMDVELSVDPEMLGRIFENLLAEINPETGESARKSTGSYYTPRPIVDYMVDESLKQYLLSHTDIQESVLNQLLSYSEDLSDLSSKDKYKILDALDQVKIIDPACGSGAFPMGILQKMVLILQKVDLEAMSWVIKQVEKISDPEEKKREQDQLMKEDWDYVRKLGIIKHSIYGIDIQQIAVEISKLRVFLSLVVDAKIDETEENLGIKPLPNLEFKFVCANTLIGLPEFKRQKTFFDNPDFSENTVINRLKRLRDEYFSSSGQNKFHIEDQFRKTQNELFNHAIQRQFTEQKSLKLSQWDPFANKPASWFDPDWMFGIKTGFDIVIANPPYVQIQKFSGRQEQENWKNQNYSTFEKTGDIYCLFYEKGMNLLKPQGILTYISSNKWLRAGYGEKTRKYFSQSCNPVVLIDFGGYQVFDMATVDTNILIIQKEKNRNKTKACTIRPDFTAETRVAAYFKDHAVCLSRLSEETWIISSSAEQTLKEKIEAMGIPLKNWDISIYRGILTGFNDAFIIDGPKKVELIAQDPKSSEIIKPVLRGRDIKRYRAEFVDLWLINAHNGYGKIDPIDVKKNYPKIRKHLDKYWDQISERQDQGVTSYNLRNCAYIEEFEREKITWGNLALNVQFAFVEKGFYINAPSPLITPANKYLLAVLNSKISDYYIRQLGVTRNGGYFEYKPMFVERLPVPQISAAKQRPFEELVDKILALTKTADYPQNETKQAKVRGYEKEIDRMVYQLYGLTAKEIEIVEGNG